MTTDSTRPRAALVEILEQNREVFGELFKRGRGRVLLPSGAPGINSLRSLAAERLERPFVLFKEKKDAVEIKSNIRVLTFQVSGKEPLFVLQPDSVHLSFYQEPVFDALKFNAQLRQHLFYLDFIIRTLMIKGKKKLRVLEPCSGNGAYSVYIAGKYLDFIDQIHVTETNPRSLQWLDYNIRLNGLENKITIHKIEDNRTKNPFDSVTLPAEFKFNLIVANPPYVPIPPWKKYPRWGNGGEFGFDVAKHIIESAQTRLKKDGFLSVVLYSLGKEYLEKGSLLTDRLDFSNTPAKLRLVHGRIKKAVQASSVLIQECYPAAWGSFEKRLAYKNPISYDVYYRSIFGTMTKRDSIYVRDLKKLKIDYLHNVVVEISPRRSQPHILVRRITTSDFETVMKLENTCWAEELRAARKNLRSRLLHFPAGFIGAYTWAGELAGFATSQRVSIGAEIADLCLTGEIPMLTKFSWVDLDSIAEADIRRTQDPGGNALHLVSGCVSPRYQGLGIWRAMIKKRLSLASYLGLPYAVVASRLAGYTIGQDVYAYLRRNDDGYIRVFRSFDFRPACLVPINKNTTSDKYWLILIRQMKDITC
jgi:tRNA1(Val) A37 N6-methylase TrmN6